MLPASHDATVTSDDHRIVNAGIAPITASLRAAMNLNPE
jgi:hypothetical protein